MTEVFVDTVGDPEMYQRKLQALFAHHTPAIQVKMYSFVCLCVCMNVCIMYMFKGWVDERTVAPHAGRPDKGVGQHVRLFDTLVSSCFWIW